MKAKAEHKTNWTVMILLILGLITIAFPLYMTIIIAFKQPSEMTNSISGILSLPSSWSLDNFREAMRVTDFWNSLKNSLIISVLTVGLSIIIHSLMGYAVGRNKAHSKFYNFVYLFIVSGMFVPFAILMMPLAKQTAEMGLGNWVGVIILYVVFYMPMNVLLYSGYLTNIPIALEEAARVDGASTWRTYWKVIFPIMKPMHATVAVITALSVWNDVMTPLVIMAGTGQNTLPLAQLNFQTQFGTNYNLAFASYLLALIPIVIVMFGIGTSAKVAIIFFAVFLTMVVTIYQGVRNVDNTLIKAARVFDATDAQLFFNVIVPASVPFILTGVRLGLATALTTLVAAELTGAATGLGTMIQQAGMYFQMDVVLLGIIVIGIIGFIFDKIVLLLEKKLTSWQEVR